LGLGDEKYIENSVAPLGRAVDDAMKRHISNEHVVSGNNFVSRNDMFLFILKM